MKVENIQDLMTAFAVEGSKKNPDTIYHTSGNMAAFLIKNIKNMRLRDLMFINTWVFYSDNRESAKSQYLLKGLLFSVLSQTNRVEIFVKRQDVNNATDTTTSSELTDILQEINNFTKGICKIDFSDDDRYHGYMYFTIQNLTKSQISNKIAV